MENTPGTIEKNQTVAPSQTNETAPVKANVEMLMDVPLTVTIELGRTEMTLRHALDLQHGAVIELDRLAGDPVDVYVNEKMIAKGEVVVVDDKFAVRITELITNGTKLNSTSSAGER